jgi:hypothetical protein
LCYSLKKDGQKHTPGGLQFLPIRTGVSYNAPGLLAPILLQAIRGNLMGQTRRQVATKETARSPLSNGENTAKSRKITMEKKKKQRR